MKATGKSPTIVEGAGGMLMELWYRFLLTVNVRPTEVSRLLDEYTKDEITRTRASCSVPESDIQGRITKITTARANLSRRLLSSTTMTIKTLLLGLKVLGVVHLKIELTATWASGRRVEKVSVSTNLGKVLIDSDLSEKDE